MKSGGGDKEVSDEPPPRGFQVGTSGGGHLEIRYRTTGMGFVSMSLAVWVGVWTAGCLMCTGLALFGGDRAHWIVLLYMLPFWLFDLAIIAFAEWHFRAVTRFEFGPEELAIERSLWWIRRRRVFLRTELKAVRQSKDEAEREDTFPSWGLALIAGTEVRVLSRQPFESSDWLGPIIAKWAGLTFEPAKERKREKYETL